MNPRTIARIARWAAAAAVLTVLAVGALLAYRAYRASRTARKELALVPPSVQQRSFQFTFSKVEGQQTIFTIRAARVTEFHGDRPNQLQDVDIVVYGEHGGRHDEIHTRACDYAPDTGSILCRGKVELDLTNVAARRQPKPGTSPTALGRSASDVRIVTSHVRFRRDTGEAQTAAPVTFSFPSGEGSATGANYSSGGSSLLLDRDVELTLEARQAGGLPERITAPGGMSYDRANGNLVLRGPVRIVQGARTMETAALVVELNRQLAPVDAIAQGRTTVSVGEGARQMRLQAGYATMSFDSKGRVDRFDASKQVFASENPPHPMTFRANRISIPVDPRSQQPRSLDAVGNVRLFASNAGKTERLETGSLHLTTVPSRRHRRGQSGRTRRENGAGKAPSLQLASAKTEAPARVEWMSGSDRLELNAGRLAASFDGKNKISRLAGRAGVRLARQIKGSTPIVTTANALDVRFSNGQWTEARESGNVSAVRGERRASAQSGEIMRSTGALDLLGDARISDADGQTLANAILWNQRTGELHASGNVRTSYFSTNAAGNASPAQAMPSAGPANVIADELDANSKTGVATYSGGARLWQGDVVIQGRRIELLRKKGELLAGGGVRAAFPQTSQMKTSSGKPLAKHSKRADEPVLWRVMANRLRYTNGTGSAKGAGARSMAGETGEAVLDGGVRAWSKDGEMDAAKLVLTFARDGEGRAEWTRAVASGGVHVRQGLRWGEAERGLYNAKQGKFVLSGGHPSLHDAKGDLVRGDRLTFYVADDTILVESSKGSRTLTRHPVPK